VKMASTSSRRHESRPWPDQRSISSSCDDTTVGRFVCLRFAKEISYSGWSKTLKACTSCPLPGGTVHCQLGARQWGILPHRRTRAQEEQDR
jgi:hypothetical protein